MSRPSCLASFSSPMLNTQNVESRRAEKDKTREAPDKRFIARAYTSLYET